MRLYVLLIVLPMLFVGCTDKEQLSSQTLSLSLGNDDGELQVIDYQVLDNPFVKSQQQGRYQAHFFDENGKVLQKINFEKVELHGSESEEANFYVSLPLISKVKRLEIYQLDGSSGHYQLKSNDPQLNWPLPEEVQQ